MNQVFTVLTDMTIVLFDLVIYSAIVPLRREGGGYRAVRAAGCVLICAFYALGAYVLQWPASLAAGACMSIPSFLLFLALSKYRDSRFILAFCLVDTVSLIVAFLGRYIGMLAPRLTWLSFLVVAALFLVIVLPGRRFFRTFRQLLETARAGWGTMAAATIFIYFAMIFFLAYPKPLVERLEYGPVWLVFAAVVLACYAVFFQSVLKTKRIQEQNEQLEQEKYIYHMAYTDPLTGLANRAAWMEKLNALERDRPAGRLCCVMVDCDRFKQVNDTYGHHAGDEALRRVADALRRSFPGGLLFRVGGDEFAVLLTDEEERQVCARLERLAAELREEGERMCIPLSAAAGYAFADETEPIEEAYVRADRQMYARKKSVLEQRQPT